MKFWIAMLLLVCLMTTGLAGAETLDVLGVILSDDFAQTHPEVEVRHGEGADYVFDTNVLMGRLLTKEFRYDIFEVDTGSIDVRQMMRKGYSLDLSQSEILQATVARMWPNFAAEGMLDGKLYALPVKSYMSVMMCHEDVWQQAGLTREDVPKTYRAFLDFLRGWIQRQQREPEAIRVFGGMDELDYNKHWYALALVEHLMENYIWQRQYAGESIRFDDPELLAMLMEAKMVGEELYQLEPRLSAEGPGPSLFDSVAGNFKAWGHMKDWFVSLRLREDQPMLVPMRLEMYIVNAGTDTPELAIQALEAIAQAKPQFSHQLLLYQDMEPVESENYPSQQRYRDGLIATVENAMANPDASLAECVDMELFIANHEEYCFETFQYWWERIRKGEDLDEVEDVLARWKKNQAEETGRWMLSPEQISDYVNFAPTIVFPPPSVFSGEEQSRNYKRLIRRFAEGEMSAFDLVTELDRIAEMVEMEAM